MSSDIAVKVENLTKCYQIYGKPQDRLKQSIYPRLQRLTGRQPTIYYREFRALSDVSFEVKRGETVGIIGRNGSGKSTLLQMICGTLNPTSGTVMAQGRVAALLELGSGFNPEFTGRENVHLNAAILGLSQQEIDARFKDIVAFADIGDFVEQPVKTYSSGMMLRLAFAVIAHVDADILVVDEALAVGDAFFTQKCMRFLRGFMKTGTVLFVSHDTGAVLNLCNRAVLLDRGAVAMIGRPKEVIQQYLVKLVEADQDVVVASSLQSAPIESPDASGTTTDYRDVRTELVNGSTLRNDIEIFRFEEGQKSWFGAGGATITSVRVLGTNDVPLSWLVGGEDVRLEIRCVAHQDFLHPIIGFQFKDRLGQVIFSDNTFLADRPDADVGRGTNMIATFEFRMPILPSGDYSITAAIADGSQEKHVQHQWMHDALILRVNASSVCQGLVGVPMKQIRIGIARSDES